MSFLDIYSEIRGSVPNLPVALAKKAANRAWADVRQKGPWSFQLFDRYQWISPPIINTGTITATIGSDQIVLDATAAAAIIAGSTSYSLVTQRQFRVGAGTIYNIWAFDGVNTLTLDRPYGEASGAGQTYAVYQVYYATPYRDFLSWLSIRDMTNFNDLDLSKDRVWVDLMDPQRTFYTFPTVVVYYQQDQNENSATYQYPMFELWGQPQYTLNYQLYGIRRGEDLDANTDELPPAVGEDVIIAKGKYYAYQWAEAHKGEQSRSAGPDYKYLMGEARKEFDYLFRQYRLKDKETYNAWMFVRRVSSGNMKFPYYSTISGTASPYGGWW